MTNVAEAVLFISPFGSDQPCTVATFHGSSVAAEADGGVEREGSGGAGQRLSEPIALSPVCALVHERLR